MAPTVSASPARGGSDIPPFGPSLPAETTTTMPALTAVFTLARSPAFCDPPGVSPKLMFSTLSERATRCATRSSRATVIDERSPVPASAKTFAPAHLQDGATPRSAL